MTDKDYKRKKQECLLDFCIEHDFYITPEVEGIFGYAFDRAYALGKQAKDAEETPITERLYEEEKSQLEWLYYYLNRAADKQENESVSVAILFEAMERLEDMFGVDLLTNGHGKNKPKDADTVIQGWVGRDMSGSLYVYCHEPERNLMKCLWEGDIMSISLSDDMFPDLTWESDPKPVEIIIKRKKNG